MIPRIGIAGLDIGLLFPGARRAGEHVHCAGIAGRVVGLVAADTRGRAVFIHGPNRQRVAVAAESHRPAEPVAPACIAGLDVGLLCPSARGTGEHVRRAGIAGSVVGLVAANAGGRAVFKQGADCQSVAVGAQGYRPAEFIAGAGIAGLDIGLLFPGARRAREYIHRAGCAGRVVGLVAIDAGGRAVLRIGPDRQRVAIVAQGNRPAEPVIGIGIAGLDIGLLLPGARRTCEHVHRAGIGDRVVSLVTIDAGGGAVFIRGSDHKRAAVTAEGHGKTELIPHPGVAGLDIFRGGDRVDELQRLVGGCLAGGIVGIAALDEVLGGRPVGLVHGYFKGVAGGRAGDGVRTGDRDKSRNAVRIHQYPVVVHIAARRPLEVQRFSADRHGDVTWRGGRCRAAAASARAGEHGSE